MLFVFFSPVHVRVLDLNKRFIGMVLYGIDKGGNQVGNFTVAQGLQFQVCVRLEDYRKFLQ